MPGSQELFSQYIEKVEQLKTMHQQDSYTYEEQFAKLHTELGRQILEQQIANEEAASCYKKKLKPGLGQ